MNLNDVKNTAIQAAYGSAQILNHFLGRLPKVNKKGPDDLVTQADLASEKQIINTILNAYPDHELLAEESGAIRGSESSPYLWIIDPLDGTTNFAHGIPIFCISIALAVNGEISVGVVLNPVSGELFTAVIHQGATLNGRPIRVSQESRLADSLLVTGFPYDAKTRCHPLIMRFERCLSASRGVRRLGSAAIDLCYVACGRFEGFWEEGLKPWDVAAGTLIAREAGGTVTDFSNNFHNINSKELLASNGCIHNDLKILLEI